MCEKNPLGTQPISKLLLKFAIPSITATLVGSLYNIVDQIFIGQGIGYLGNAATNVSYPFSTICLAIALLLGIGSASRFSLSLGQGEKERAARIAGNGVVLMVIFGVVYLILGELFLTPLLLLFGSTPDVLPYAQTYAGVTMLGMPFLIVTNGISALIRADGRPTYSMVCMVTGAVINTILDPIFIFTFGWGMFGAALATILGQILSCLLALLYLPRFRTIQLTPGCFRGALKGCLPTLYAGSSSSLNQVAITVVQIVLNNSLTYYGASSVYGSDIPLAACGIVMKTNAILLSIIVGISQGVQPIIGFNYGAGQYTRVKKALKMTIVWNLVISAIGFCLFQFCPAFILSLFGSGDALYMEFAVLFMRTFLFMVLLNGVQLLSSNFFTAIGQAPKGLFLAMTRQIFFLIPLLLLLPLWMGVFGVLVSGPCADFIAFVVSVIMVRKQFARMPADRETDQSEMKKA